MDKNVIKSFLPQAPETYVSICVCSDFSPYPLVYLSSDEEGVVGNPMVYPQSCGEGFGMVSGPVLFSNLYWNELAPKFAEAIFK